MTAPAKPDPLGVRCRWKYCRSRPGQPCSTIAESGPRRGDYVDRKPHASRVKLARRLALDARIAERRRVRLAEKEARRG